MSTDTKDIDTDNHQAEKRVLIAAIAAQGLALFALASLFALLPTMIRDLQLTVQPHSGWSTRIP